MTIFGERCIIRLEKATHKKENKMKIKRKVWISTLLFVGAASLMAFLSSVLIGDEKILMNVSAASTTDLDGKTVLFDGDSIAMGSAANGEGNPGGRWSYANYIEETYGAVKTNLAFGGARFYWPDANANCIDGTADCHVIPRHLTSTIKDNNYDYIILEGAFNDLHHSYLEGDTESYERELRNYFETVTTNPRWASAKIGFVIVPKPDYSRKMTYVPAQEKVFWKQIQRICDDYSIEYINFFKQSNDDDFVVPDSFDWDFIDTNVTDANSVGSFDGVHPSKGGQRVLGEYIAKWMVNLPNYKYTVSFDANGASLSGATDQSVVHGKKATVPTYTMNNNQHFDHWSTSKTGASYNFNNAVNSNLKLYAVWHIDVTFDGNGGRIDGQASITSSVIGGSKVSNPGDATRAGYSFKYWSEDNSCSRAYDFNAGLSEDKTLYACWTELPSATHSLNFNLNGGSGQMNVLKCTTIETSCEVTIPDTKPVFPGYDFLGYADASGATEAKYQPGDSIVLNSDKTIFAIWKEKSSESQSDEKQDDVIDGSSSDTEDPSSKEDSKSEGGLILPDTSIGVPDTGYDNKQTSDTVDFVVICVGPIIITVVVLLWNTKSRNNRHRRFE